MIESKLYQAAHSLPTPKINFFEIEKKANLSIKNQNFRTRKYRMVAAMLICTLLLMGCALVAATTEANYSAWATRSNAFRDVNKIATRLGVALPETLDDNPFYNITTMHVVPEGTTYLEAFIKPAYLWYSVDYGIQDVVREYNTDAPGSGFSESSVVYDEYSISFGSTDNELFRYVFALDETGTHILENAFAGSYRTEDYNGITMQIGTDVQYDGDNDSDVFAYHHWVTWVDDDNHAVFSLHKSFHADDDAADQFPNEMIAFAKEIIDMNI